MLELGLERDRIGGQDDLERVRLRRVGEDVVGLLRLVESPKWCVANGVGSSRPSAISFSSFGVVNVSTSRS